MVNEVIKSIKNAHFYLTLVSALILIFSLSPNHSKKYKNAIEEVRVLISLQEDSFIDFVKYIDKYQFDTVDFFWKHSAHMKLKLDSTSEFSRTIVFKRIDRISQLDQILDFISKENFLVYTAASEDLYEASDLPRGKPRGIGHSKYF